LGRSRGGLTTKIRAATLDENRSVVLQLTPGQASDCAQLDSVYDALPEDNVLEAGGRRDTANIRIGDLGEAFSDERLRQVRKKLRRDYAFPHGEDVLFGVRCVWSIAAPIYPQADGTA